MASLTGGKSKREIKDDSDEDHDSSDDSDGEDIDSRSTHSSKCLRSNIQEPKEKELVGLQLHWLYHDQHHVWFIIKSWTDLEQKCQVEEHGLRVYWTLSKPTDDLLSNDLHLNLHSAHQMVHDLKGDYWIPSPLVLISSPELVEVTNSRGYKVIKVKVNQGSAATRTLF